MSTPCPQQERALGLSKGPSFGAAVPLGLCNVEAPPLHLTPCPWVGPVGTSEAASCVSAQLCASVSDMMEPGPCRGTVGNGLTPSECRFWISEVGGVSAPSRTVSGASRGGLALGDAPC